MNREFGFRHALAAAQVLFFLAVSGYSQYSRYEMRSSAGDDSSAPAGAGVRELVQVCAIVNAPAVLAFGWIGKVVPAFVSWFAIVLTGAGVYAQWYVVGLWRDESTEVIQRKAFTKVRRTVRLFWWVGAIAAILAGALSIAAQILYLESSNAFLISLAIWCGFFAVFLIARIRGTEPI